jgi:hypothetical protein
MRGKIEKAYRVQCGVDGCGAEILFVWADADKHRIARMLHDKEEWRQRNRIWICASHARLIKRGAKFDVMPAVLASETNKDRTAKEEGL